jgi:hypothetical protein
VNAALVLNDSGSIALNEALLDEYNKRTRQNCIPDSKEIFFKRLKLITISFTGLPTANEA